MTKVKFALQEEADGLELYHLPISIKNASLEVVENATLNREINLEDGYYLASAVLPHGQEFRRAFQITGDAPAMEVMLRTVGEPGPDAQDLLLEEDPSISAPALKQVRLRLQHQRLIKTQRAAIAPDVALQAGTQIRVYAGNLLTGTGQQADAGLQFSSEGQILLSGWRLNYVGQRSRPTYALIALGAAAPSLVALPISENEEAYIEIVAADDAPVIRVKPRNPRTALQLGYLAADMFEEGSRVAPADAEEAKEMLRGKTDSPVAAAIGAYILLAGGGLERLSAWVRNLYEWIDWLPDGAVIYGELLARRGDHKNAISMFLEIEERGLPLLTGGVRIIMRRLTGYASLMRHDKISGERANDVARLLSKLSELTGHLKDDQSLLTFEDIPAALHLPPDGRAAPLERG